MKPRNSSSASYAPGDVPTNAADLNRFIREELDKISATVRLLAAGHLDKAYAAPAKPRDGDWAYADGTTWNPGGGKGVYLHNGSVWTLIKAIP